MGAPGLAHPERAVAVTISLEETPGNPQEFDELIRAAGGQLAARLRGRRQRPDPRTFIGSGKVTELRELAHANDAELILFDHHLSPSQERNLEHELGIRVLDRTGLILAIFARRARTHEGRLQVELAQLQHLLPRLVGRAPQLSRQQGGIGLRGPGETQLETDRRLIRGRIDGLQRKLDLVAKRRQQARSARRRGAAPTVALAGYTNAGKSTLFNALTGASVLAENQLFATLDPTLRRVETTGIGTLVLSDTVGFIRSLPHQLVAAFRATLEEVAQADLVLEIIDAADPEWQAQIACVEAVLADIGAGDVPRLRVFNKIDRIADAMPRLQRDAAGRPSAVWLSASSAAGFPLLHQALRELLIPDLVYRRLHLPPDQGRTRALLHQARAVVAESPAEDGGTILDLCVPAARLAQIMDRAARNPPDTGAAPPSAVRNPNTCVPDSSTVHPMIGTLEPD